MSKLLAMTLWMGSNLAMASTSLNARTAMIVAGTAADQSSVVTGQTTWRSNARGVVHAHKTLGWQTLAGTPVMGTTTSERPGRGPFCQVTENQQSAPGGRSIHLYKEEEGHREARIILGSGEGTAAIFAALQPGESVQVIEAHNPDTGERMEHLELQRAEDRLSLTRVGQGAEICYETGS